jgi:hypothetical protein
MVVLVLVHPADECQVVAVDDYLGAAAAVAWQGGVPWVELEVCLPSGVIFDLFCCKV